MGKRADKRSFTQPGGSHGARGGAPARGAGRGKGASPARRAALEAVRTLRERDAFAQDVMARVVDCAPLSPEDRAFATRLVLGVVSARGVLDEVLDRCMRSPHDVTLEVRDALQISAYEIIFLEKSPHAAVDQGVELVRGIAPRAGGVANVVLRRVVAAKDAFPFGDPVTDVAAYARLHGFPEWLAKKAIADLGPRAAHSFLVASNEPAPLFVGVNAVRASDEDVLRVLEEAGGEPQPVSVRGREVAGCYRVRDGRVLLDGGVSQAIDNGLMLVSDAASQAVASLVLPDAKPASLLEIGAGRATKTVLLQSDAVRTWGSQIDCYVALDNRDFKTRILVDRAAQYGINVSEAVRADATKLEDAMEPGRTFDVVFIDAPCTGLGTLRRHGEIRWRIQPETIQDHAHLGRLLLESAAARVSVGGVLAYATCTITSEENASVVAGFLKSPSGKNFELEPILGASAFSTELEPGGPDAHFLAKMRRVS